ncbi:MAG TPA: EamA family transporter [Cytophagaceae bacterium]|jgi:transporter family protein|nr:EamA family transporter [Cytophagaceae bacterium]
MQTWLIYAILSMFFAGLTSVLAKHGLKEISADLALVVRTTVVFGMVLINFFLWQEIKSVGQLSYKAILFLVLSGLTTSFSWIFYYKAIKIGDVSMVASIDKCSLLITLILSFVFLKEPLTPKIVFGAGFIFTGMMIMVWK